jgi:thiol-disulfide isomerase/thioredoxin
MLTRIAGTLLFAVVLAATPRSAVTVSGPQGAGTAAVGQQAGSQALPEPKTILECLRAAESYPAARLKELRAAGQPIDRVKVEQEATDLAARYADRYSVDKMAPDDLVPLARLCQAAKQPARAQQALARRLALPGITDDQKADTLAAGVEICMGRATADEGVKQAETFAAELDTIRGAGRQQIQVHSRLGTYYRAADVDDRILQHGSKVIALARALSAAERAALGTTLAAAYTNVAEVYGGREQSDRAVAILEQALTEVRSVPGARSVIEPTLARYRLVGTAAAPIEAAHWFNAPAATSMVHLKGTVTLVEFTAHWCTWCRRTYPSIVRLHERWAGKGLQVVFATELYGFFGEPRALTAEQELEADRRYFLEEHRLPFKIAIENQRKPVPGQSAAPNPNEDRYKVGGIPQIVVVDKAGKIRAILIGSDPAYEARLNDMVERLLAEKGARP